MTRTEAIATITSTLASLDDERVQTVAEIVAEIAAPNPVRPLSAREFDLLEQSHQDFKNGRTYSHDEVIDYLDAHLAPLGVPKHRS